MIRCSIDFDGSLTRDSLQKYAIELISRGIEVWICTARFDSIEKYTGDFMSKYKILSIKEEHEHLFNVADRCGISRDHIKFMNMAYKSEFFLENEGFLWHLDDDYVECREINQNTKTVAVSCANGSNWRHKCERLIKKKLNE
jgi:hypothetical protein